MLRRAILVEPQENLVVVQDDPADDRILETAVAGATEAILAGDKYLRKPKKFRDIPIMRTSRL